MEEIGKIDLRGISNDELYRIKKTVVRMRSSGIKRTEVAKHLNIKESSVDYIWGDYNKAKTVIKPTKRGRKKGYGTHLSKEQSIEIRKMLIDKTPNQYKLGFMLWTRKAVCQLVLQKYDIVITERLMSEYLKGWGMSCQRPSKQAYARDIIKVNDFKQIAYPTIKARAMACKGEIYWGDETGLNNHANYERGFSLRGQTPILKHEGKKYSQPMISAISNQGHCKFKFYDDAMNQDKFIDFMQGLINDSKHKVFFIVDNLKVHHGKQVKEWLEQNTDKIELFFIPPYSPDLNPDEYLNHALKRDVHSGNRPLTKDDMRYKATMFMSNLSCNSERVLAFFNHKNLDFIAV